MLPCFDLIVETEFIFLTTNTDQDVWVFLLQVAVDKTSVLAFANKMAAY